MSDEMNDLAQGTFDLDEFVSGRGFPKAKVTLHTAVDAVQELVEANEKMTDIAQDREGLDKRSKQYKENQAEYAELEARAEELKKHIAETSLTFHLRGISPGHIKQVQKNIVAEATKANKAVDEGDENAEPYTEEMVADHLNADWIVAHIQTVAKGDGLKAAGPIKRANVLLWKQMLPEDQWVKLSDKVSELSFRSTYFDAAVNAGFLQKS